MMTETAIHNVILASVRDQNGFIFINDIANGYDINRVKLSSCLRSLENGGFLISQYGKCETGKKIRSYKSTDKQGRFFKADRRSRVLKKAVYRTIKNKPKMTLSQLYAKYHKLNPSEVQCKLRSLIKDEDIIVLMPNNKMRKAKYMISSKKEKSESKVKIDAAFNNAFAALFYGAPIKQVSA